MAEIHPERLAQITKIDGLTERIAASRKSLGDAAGNLKSASNLSRRVKTSIRSNVTTWLGSAAVLGLVLAKLPARKKKIYLSPKGTKGDKTEAAAKGGILIAILGLAFQLVRPVLQKLVVEQIGLYAEKYQTRSTRPKTARSNSTSSEE